MGKGAQKKSSTPPAKGNNIIQDQKVKLITEFFKKEKANPDNQKEIKGQPDGGLASVENPKLKDRHEVT